MIDGSRHVAALRQLAEIGSANGVGLSGDVTALFDACPVTIVRPETDPAFVLALLADATDAASDPWLHSHTTISCGCSPTTVCTTAARR